jgi:hypothetical protein
VYELLLFFTMLNMVHVVEFMVKMENSPLYLISFAKKFFFY